MASSPSSSASHALPTPLGTYQALDGPKEFDNVSLEVTLVESGACALKTCLIDGYGTPYTPERTQAGEWTFAEAILRLAFPDGARSYRLNRRHVVTMTFGPVEVAAWEPIDSAGASGELLAPVTLVHQLNWNAKFKVHVRDGFRAKGWQVEERGNEMHMSRPQPPAPPVPPAATKSGGNSGDERVS